VTQTALVIGGGIAGMQAALDIADANFHVYLVEREPYIGGRMAQLNTTFPTLERVPELIAPLIGAVLSHPNIQVFANADVKQVDGFIGNFRVTVNERPTFVDPDKCSACGKCAEVCPISVPDGFNAFLTSRRAIYQIPVPSHRAPSKGGREGVSPFAVDWRACAFLQDRVCKSTSTAGELRPGYDVPPSSIDSSMEQELYHCSSKPGELNSQYAQAKELHSFANAEEHLANASEVSSDAPCIAVCPEHAIDLELQERSVDVQVGAIVVATGAATFDATKAPELGFGKYPNVITSLQFERLANPAGPTQGRILVDGREPTDVVFIQCVGSRDQTKGNPYCSRVCCMVSAKQAFLIRERLPQTKVSVLYADVRAFGKGFEEFYDAVRKSGVRYRRGYASEVYRRGDKLMVRAEDTLIQKQVEVPADLVVLSIGLVPRGESDEIAGLLGLTRSGDGFMAESHPKLRPVDTMVDGVFLAGTCQGPKDIVETISQAKAAASSVLSPLCRGRVKIESATSFVEPELCAGCGLCASACAYGALSLDGRTHKIRVNDVLCKGCGACAAACPSKAIQVMQFTPRQILSQIAAMA
jgi:heterodisulfide reductase subunit A2